MINKKENFNLQKISKHVEVLNHEVGDLKLNMGIMKTDVKWLKRISWYIAGIMSLGLGKIIFIS